MKKVVLVTYEGIYSLPLVEAFLNNKNVSVVKILKSGSIYANLKGFRGVWFLLKRSSLLFIVPKFFENILFIIYCFFVPSASRPFKTLAELEQEYQIPVEVVDDVNKYDHCQHEGTVLFSSYFNQIFTEKTLSNYSQAFNIHPAPLPVGRGLFSQFWLLLKPYCEKKYYQTIHRMTSKIDDGEVVMQQSVAASKTPASMADYMNKVTVLGIDMMKNFDVDIDGDFHRPNESSYNSFPKAGNVLDFWCKGLSFIRYSDIRNYFKIKVPK